MSSRHRFPHIKYYKISSTKPVIRRFVYRTQPNEKLINSKLQDSPAVTKNEPIVRRCLEQPCSMLTIRLFQTWKFWLFACSRYVLIYSPDDTNIYGSRGGRSLLFRFRWWRNKVYILNIRTKAMILSTSVSCVRYYSPFEMKVAPGQRVYRIKYLDLDR